MGKYSEKLLDEVGEVIWWDSFQTTHKDELHLYDEATKPLYSRMQKRRRLHYRRKAAELLDILAKAGYKVVKK